MAKIWNSEEVSKKYFADLGYKILEKDKEGKKKGCDFFIEKDGIIQSVEAKMRAHCAINQAIQSRQGIDFLQKKQVGFQAFNHWLQYFFACIKLLFIFVIKVL